MKKFIASHPEIFWPIFIAVLFFLLLAILDVNLPSPLESGRRTPLSRVRADQRTLATAIEAYYLDFHAYPPHTYDYSHAQWKAEVRMPTFRSSSPGSLTTPIAWVTEYPREAFLQRRDKRTFAYYTAGDNWIVISAGPNCRFDLQPETLETVFNTTDTTTIQQTLLPYTYDPSNGADSAGDVWRIKQ